MSENAKEVMGSPGEVQFGDFATITARKTCAVASNNLTEIEENL